MQYYIINAFTSETFGGNPAGVCILEKQLPHDMMQKIAMENHLPETAFVLKTINGYQLQWFTPDFEIDLCGYATLATAFVLSQFVDMEKTQFCFFTKSGILKVEKKQDLYELEFPVRPMKQINCTEKIIEVTGIVPKEIYYR